jgi:hypothetical protein
MKKFLTIIIIASFSMVGCYTPGQVAQSDNYNYSDNYNNADLSYQTFYDQLQPYGNWINYPEYGNVWQPYMRDGFTPYETGGHWVSTVDGWAWASDYNWGWAPFHYGRWFFEPSIGWAWVPGYEWAPAWVTWGQYNNYYAWAPLAPGINISLGNTWRAPSNYWSFVPRNYINSPNLGRYATRNLYNANVNNITIINNYNSYNQQDYYHRGPDYQEVQRFTRQPITPVRIASTNRPGASRLVNREFEVFRPSRFDNTGNTNNNNNNNGATRQITVPGRTRQYNGAINGNSPTGSGITRPDDRIRRNPALNDVRADDNKGQLSNGVNNGNSGVTQQDIDNTNRRLQQQQIERLYRSRTQPAENNGSIYTGPSDMRQIPQNTPQNNLPNIQRPPVRSSAPPADNSQPVRPQPRLQDQRIMQSPAFPPQNERIMRPPSQPSMPNRMENRVPNPVRSIPIERPPRRQ